MGTWLAVVAALVVVAALGWRWQRSRLPLRLGGVAVRDEILGRPVLRVRACLGDGRVVRTWRAEGVWRGRWGERVAVPQEAPGPRVGAWTLTFADPPEAASLELVVTADAKGRSWEARRDWVVADAVAGRFAPLLEGAPGRWRLSRGWDDARPTDEGAETPVPR